MEWGGTITTETLIFLFVSKSNSKFFSCMFTVLGILKKTKAYILRVYPKHDLSRRLNSETLMLIRISKSKTHRAEILRQRGGHIN